MLIGAMNHPKADIVSEIRWMAEMGLEFVDLTLEPPAASSWRVEPAVIRRALSDHNLKVVGHTAYYLPTASPFESLRRAACDELKRCLDVFCQVGARWMNLHPDRYAPMHDRAFYIGGNIKTLTELIEYGRGCPVGLMIENLPADYNSAPQLGELLDPLPELGLHLDIGHANLVVPHNTTEEILAAYGKRLRHVHLHDNKGGSADLHLPLGSGTLDVQKHLRTLHDIGYDATITLEVFAEDRTYLRYSRDLLRKWWDEIAASTRAHALTA